MFSKTNGQGLLKAAQSQIKAPTKKESGKPSEDDSKVQETKSIRLMKPLPKGGVYCPIPTVFVLVRTRPFSGCVSRLLLS